MREREKKVKLSLKEMDNMLFFPPYNQQLKLIMTADLRWLNEKTLKARKIARKEREREKKKIKSKN